MGGSGAAVAPRWRPCGATVEPLSGRSRSCHHGGMTDSDSSAGPAQGPSDDPPRTRTIHALVAGRVQGVGFRFHCAGQAQDLGLVGEVRNLPDGDVEVLAQGPADDVSRLVAWLYHGPQWASVSRVRLTEMAPGSLRARRFEITY